MHTTYYTVQNIHEHSEYESQLKDYLKDVEKIYPVIEEVFGERCNFSPITIDLNTSANWSYSGAGIVHIDITDGSRLEQHLLN